MNIHLALCAALLIVFSQPQAADLSEGRALSESAQKQRTANKANAPINSKIALAKYLRDTPLQNSPLNRLSKSAQHRFISSLTFNENGITGYRYSDLEAELTPTQIFDILALIGAQHTVPLLSKARVESPEDSRLLSEPNFVDNPGAQFIYGKDYPQYSCANRKNCMRNPEFICLDGC